MKIKEVKTYLLVISVLGLCWARSAALEDVIVVISCRNDCCSISGASTHSFIMHDVLGIVVVSVQKKMSWNKTYSWLCP